MRAWIRNAWLSLEEPRWVTAVQLAVYTIAISIGAVTWFDPPNALVSTWGATLTDAWALLTTIGGVLGILGCSRGLWWLEAHGLHALWLAIAMRVLLVATLHVTTTGSRVTQLLELVMLLACLVARWLRIKDVPIDPKRAP